MTVEALRTLDRAGVVLAGDVVVSFVGDEESGEPGTGVSAGMKAFVPLLVLRVVLPRPDMAIYVEPTTLDIYAGADGVLHLRYRDHRPHRILRSARRRASML